MRLGGSGLRRHPPYVQDEQRGHDGVDPVAEGLQALLGQRLAGLVEGLVEGLGVRGRLLTWTHPHRQTPQLTIWYSRCELHIDTRLNR